MPEPTSPESAPSDDTTVTGDSASLIQALIARRWLAFTAMMLISAIAAGGLLRVGFDTSLEALLTHSDPYLEDLEYFNGQFPQSLTINAVFVPPEGDTAFAESTLTAIGDLQESFRQLGAASRISTPLNYFSPERQERLFQSPFQTYSTAELDKLLARALDDRLLTNSLLAPDGSLAFATIYFDEQDFTSEARLDLASAALQFRDELRTRHPTVDIHFSSDVLLEQSSQQAMVDDMTNLLPVVIMICVLVICYCFRSVLLGVSILSHALLSVLLTVGTLGYLGFSFNSISIIAPLVVVIIAVANSVHIISIFNQSLGRGETRLSAMTHSVSYNLRPITLAMLTTAIGFSSLNLCSSPAIQDFGRIVAIGIVYAYLLTLTVLPALLILLTRFDAARPQDSFLRRPLEWIVTAVGRYDRQLFIGCTALGVITLMLLPLNETDFNRLDFITGDNNIRDYYDIVSEGINRGPQLTYGVTTRNIDGAIEPEFLHRLDGYVAWLNEQTEIETAASVVDLVKTVNRVQHQEDPAHYAIPDDIDTVAAYLNGYEAVQSEDYPLLAFINNDFSMVTLIINATPMSNQSLIDLDDRISTEFTRHFDSAELIHGSGLLLFARMDELVTVELLQGYSLSLLLITLCLIVGLRSVHFGILSVIPNLLPATIVFGIWALFVGQLDPFVMMLFSISIGLVVDDTVHILSHYLSGKQQGMEQAGAIRHAITVAGPALTITTLVLALGTTILISANTLYFQQSAKLLVPIVVLALALDLFYLPTILKRFDKTAPAQ